MLLVPLMFALTSTAEVGFYVGTYGKGIYYATLDVESGKMSEPELAVEATAPSFVTLSPNGKYLYAVHETNSGEVSAYAVAGKKLTLINTQPTKGAHPCHVAVDPSGKFVFTAAYTGGSLASFAVKPDGSLGEPHLLQNTGSGPDKNRQEKPHVHSVVPAPKNGVLYACDLGTDEILVVRPKADGTLELGEPRSAKAPAGGGPRHLALHPSGAFAFVNNEMKMSVTSYKVDPATGMLSQINTAPTVPPGTGGSTAAIGCHVTGKWLYVSNRGDDSITQLAIAADGRLTPMEIAKAGVKTPRGFALDPSGRWLVVGGQDSDEIVVFSINQETGKLRRMPNRIQVGKPVCIAFAP